MSDKHTGLMSKDKNLLQIRLIIFKESLDVSSNGVELPNSPSLFLFFDGGYVKYNKRQTWTKCGYKLNKLIKLKKCILRCYF